MRSLRKVIAVGGRGGSSGMTNVKNNPEYKSDYKYEKGRALEEVPIASSMKSEKRTDSDVEQEMIRYRSAIGDPIAAMKRQRQREQNTLNDYEGAKTPGNIGTRDALREVMKEYDEAIKRMKKIKEKSKYKGMM